MTIDRNDLHAFPSQESYYLSTDGNLVGVALIALAESVEFICFDDLDGPIPPGAEYPSIPAWDGLHRLDPGTALEEVAARHGLALRPREPLRDGQVAVAYGTSSEQAGKAWHSQAARDGFAALDNHELEIEELDKGPGRPALWRAAAHVRARS